MELLLHIGYPKTGSTAIQSHIYTNRQWLLARDVYVPEAGLASGTGHAYLLGTHDSPIVRATEDATLRGKPVLEELREELRRAQGAGFSRAVLSWEGFALASNQAVRNLLGALTEHRLTLLLYVRDQSDQYQSTILQAVKELYMYSSAPLGAPDPDALCSSKNDYLATINRWKDCADGGLDVRVRLFEREALVHSNIVEDFLAAMDLSIDPHFSLEGGNINAGLDFFSAAYLVAARQQGVPYLRQRILSRALSATIAQLGRGSTAFLTAEQAAQVRAHFCASNEKLFTDFRPENAPLDARNFASSDPGEEVISPVAGRDGMNTLHHYLQAPPLELWQGEILVENALTRILRAPCRGWRGAGKTGVWSVGTESDIAFAMPLVDPVEGPRRIRLTIAGVYHGQNKSTRVLVDGSSEERDLRNAEIVIDLDDQVRKFGVKLELIHAFPAVAQGSSDDGPNAGIAFKVSYLSYRFEW